MVLPVDEVERLLRMLALNNEDSLQQVLAPDSDRTLPHALPAKVDLLVRLGALLALGASTPALRRMVERAVEAGASEAEIADVLVSVAPMVGLARVVTSAPRLALALGYDLDSDT